jgi:cold shock protein
MFPNNFVKVESSGRERRITRFTGIVVWFQGYLGFGFIRSSAFQRDIFVHYSGIVRNRFDRTKYRSLQKGSEVVFEIAVSRKGKRAIRVVQKGRDKRRYQNSWKPKITGKGLCSVNQVAVRRNKVKQLVNVDRHIVGVSTEIGKIELRSKEIQTDIMESEITGITSEYSKFQTKDAETQTEKEGNEETTDDVCKELVSYEEFVKCKRFREMAEERIKYLNVKMKESNDENEKLQEKIRFLEDQVQELAMQSEVHRNARNRNDERQSEKEGLFARSRRVNYRNRNDGRQLQRDLYDDNDLFDNY